MAQESDLSKTADKGKGKAVDDETQKDKAGQPVANGKKDDDKAECLFSLSCAARRYGLSESRCR
jgi:26S proteasome regulatory subunit N1